MWTHKKLKQRCSCEAGSKTWLRAFRHDNPGSKRIIPERGKIDKGWNSPWAFHLQQCFVCTDLWSFDAPDTYFATLRHHIYPHHPLFWKQECLHIFCPHWNNCALYADQRGPCKLCPSESWSIYATCWECSMCKGRPLDLKFIPGGRNTTMLSPPNSSCLGELQSGKAEQWVLGT